MYRHYMLAIDDFNYYPSVVFHSVIKDEDSIEKYKEYKRELDDMGVSYYSHLITTEEPSIESVLQASDFFRYAKIFNSFELFKNGAY